MGQAPALLPRAPRSLSGPVTGNSTLAAWLIQSERSSVVGSRPDAGCFNRSTEEAPPRQLGLAGRARRGAAVEMDLVERFSDMATTSFVGFGPPSLGRLQQSCVPTSATSVPCRRQGVRHRGGQNLAQMVPPGVRIVALS